MSFVNNCSMDSFRNNSWDSFGELSQKLKTPLDISQKKIFRNFPKCPSLKDFLRYIPGIRQSFFQSFFQGVLPKSYYGWIPKIFLGFFHKIIMGIFMYFLQNFLYMPSKICPTFIQKFVYEFFHGFLLKHYLCWDYFKKMSRNIEKYSLGNLSEGIRNFFRKSFIFLLGI